MLREIDSLEILSNIRGTLHPILQGDWLMRIIGLAGYVGIGWISYWIWRHRDWLLASLRPPVIEVTASSAGRSSGWTNDRWLAVVWMGVLVALAVQVLWALIVTVGMIAWVGNLAVWSSGAVGWSMLLGLLSACFPLFLVILLLRRELRRVKVTPPSSPPAWFPRFIQFTLVIAIVCSIPLAFGDLSSATLSATQAPAAGVETVTPISATMTSVGYGGFISVFALALLTRCRIWRAIATAFLTVLLVSTTTGVLLIWPTEPSEFGGGRSYQVGLGLVMACYSLTALIVSVLPSARAAFGLPPRHGGCTHPAAAPVHP